MTRPIAWTESEIPFGRIDRDDHTHRITTQPCTDELVASIQALGMTTLPLLKPRNRAFSIVSGFRRIEAVRVLAQDTVSVRILDDGVSQQTCAHIAIAENALQRPLNPVEQSRSLALLSRFHKESHLAASARSHGLPCHPELIQKLIRLNDLPEQIHPFLIDGTVSLPVALTLNRLDTGVSVLLARLFKLLKYGLNKQRELITIITEIAICDETTVGEILDSEGVLNILKNPRLDRGTKSTQLRSHLRARRYPHLTQIQKAFQAGVKQLKLGPGTSLLPPKDFEGTQYTLTLSFDRLSALDRHKNTIKRIVQDPYLQKFIDIGPEAPETD